LTLDALSYSTAATVQRFGNLQGQRRRYVSVSRCHMHSAADDYEALLPRGSSPQSS